MPLFSKHKSVPLESHYRKEGLRDMDKGIDEVATSVTAHNRIRDPVTADMQAGLLPFCVDHELPFESYCSCHIG